MEFQNNYLQNLKYRLLLKYSNIPVSGTYNDLLHFIQPHINRLIVNIKDNNFGFDSNISYKTKVVDGINMIDGYSINYLLKYLHNM